MPRVLLILPTATYRATAFLDAARLVGAGVVTASERPQALASVMRDRFLEIPLDDPETAATRICDLAARHPLDAVVAVDDQGLLAANLAAGRLGLVHNPRAAIAATRDKAEMRALLAAAGVPQPTFEVVRDGDGSKLGDLAADAAGRLGYPVVLKPVGLSASRGVIRAEDEDEVREAAARVLRLLRRLGEPPALLVEGYVGGDEVAVEALLVAGRLQPLAVFDKPDPLVGPFFEETIYVTPSRHPAELQQAVVAAVQRAAEAIGLREGPVHAEARLTVAGARPPTVTLLELAARTIGGRCAAALRFAAERPLEALVLDHALGRPLSTELAPGSSGVMMLPIPASGRLEAVEGIDRAKKVPGITGVEITVPIGQRVVALPEGDRYLGFLFARRSDPAATEAALRAAHAELDIRIAGQAVAGAVHR